MPFRCVYAQQEDVYDVNFKWELPTSVAFLSASYFGFRELDRYSSLNISDVTALDPNSVNSFDRPVIFNDPSYYDRAHELSDIALNISVGSPIVLLLDRNVRKDWKEVSNMFLMAHTVDNALYFATTFTVRRARPLTYVSNYEIGKRTGDAKSNSFFSGHVSFSATSTFFAAKVYTDYHQIKSWKRLLIYAGAAIPPSIVGYYRMKAGKHFRTDVIVGLLVGAASGIIVPELHRNKYKNAKLSFQPFNFQNYKGVTLNWKL